MKLAYQLIRLYLSQTDDFPIFNLCVAAQAYYKAHQLRTKVLPASLVCAEDALRLSGVDHITIAPRILQGLATTKSDSELSLTRSLFDEPLSVEPWPAKSFINNEEDFRSALAQEEGGVGEGKLKQVCNA